MGLWQFWFVWSLGFFLERKINLGLPYGYRAALAFGLGEVCISYSLFLLGLIGGLRFWVLVPAAVLIFLVCLPSFIKELRTIFKTVIPILRSDIFTVLVIAVLLLIYILAACVPEREVDSLWYHLGVPFYYITHGGFIQLVPFIMPSHYPMNVHLHYTLSLLIGNDTTVKVFILCHFIPFLILMWSVVKRYAGARWGLFALTVYLCCLHFRLPVMANVQRAVYFYVFLSYVLLWWFFETRQIKVFLLAALFCGMAMGTKFNGILFCYISQWLLILGWLIFACRNDKLNGFKLWITHSVIAWLMLCPWLIKSYLLTNNPFYPMLGAVFNTYEEFVPAMLSNDHNHGLNLLKSQTAAEFFGQIWTNIQWLLYNADLIFFIGILSVLLLLFFPVKNKTYPLVTGWIAYGLFTMLWGSDIARLFGVNYGVIVLLITMTLQQICEHPSISRRVGKTVYWFVILSLFLTFMKEKYMYLSSPNIRWYGGVYVSEKARYDWLTEREIFTPDLFHTRDWLRDNFDPDEEIYGYRTGYLFYLERKYIVSGAHFQPQIDRWLDISLEHAAQQLRNMKISFLLYTPMWKQGIPTIPHPLFEKFLEQYCEPIHTEGHLTLYKMIF